MQSSELVNAVKLMRVVPQVKEQIQNEAITITTASQIQRFINQEKKVGNPISFEQTAEILETCKGLSKREIEKTLLAQASEPAKIICQERVRTVTESLTELKFLVSESTLEVLSEVKNLIGNEALSKIFDQSLRVYLETEKKKRGRTENIERSQESTLPVKPETKSRSRFIPIHVVRAVSRRSGGQCEFVDPKTQIRCCSKFRLQLDHHPVPFSKGGKNTVDGLRHLCQQHNLRTAIEAGLQLR